MSRRKHEPQPWTPAHVDYAQKVAIGLAVELTTGDRHPYYSDNNELRHQKNPYSTAAKFLGAIGVDRSELLFDLTGLLRLHGVEPTPMVASQLEQEQAS